MSFLYFLLTDLSHGFYTMPGFLKQCRMKPGAFLNLLNTGPRIAGAQLDLIMKKQRLVLLFWIGLLCLPVWAGAVEVGAPG